MSTGTIFNIQKFSVNDGPGIRTTVFMKGCPLNCLWCHNPESKKVKKEIFYNKEKCSSCGMCIKACPSGCHSFEGVAHLYDRERCTACGKCTETCLNSALEAVGKEISAEEVIKEVMKDKIFYENSGGGMTLSGGEPMAQFNFTYELLSMAKNEGLHTCIETCGYAKEENYLKIVPLTDIFLFDYKVTGEELHKKYTGVSNELILSNLKAIDSAGGKSILRCPIIPGINDTEEHFCGIAKTAESLKNILEINIEPYHPLGKGKSEMLGKDYPLGDLGFPENDTVTKWMDFISERTSVPVKKA
ncbi:MAG: glycyl-radical enzyme activating protein [Ruminococcaceae bacterium]|nr:glycyl-radical enzyme activating protein [Oscillospiraceae bacterium]